jgi:hypothetical protein
MFYHKDAIANHLETIYIEQGRLESEVARLRRLLEEKESELNKLKGA